MSGKVKIAHIADLLGETARKKGSVCPCADCQRVAKAQKPKPAQGKMAAAHDVEDSYE